MTLNKWTRQIHRWLAIAFTLAVIANIACMALSVSQGIAMAVGFSALVPLIPLLATGLYMFVLPYTAKGQAQRSLGAPQ